jgi:hypothetical protein
MRLALDESIGCPFNFQPMAAFRRWPSRVATITRKRQSAVRLNIAVSDDAYCRRWRRRIALPLDPTDASTVRCCCDTFLGRRRHERDCTKHKAINRAAFILW